MQKLFRKVKILSSFPDFPLFLDFFFLYFISLMVCCFWVFCWFDELGLVSFLGFMYFLMRLYLLRNRMIDCSGDTVEFFRQVVNWQNLIVEEFFFFFSVCRFLYFSESVEIVFRYKFWFFNETLKLMCWGLLLYKYGLSVWFLWGSEIYGILPIRWCMLMLIMWSKCSYRKCSVEKTFKGITMWKMQCSSCSF